MHSTRQKRSGMPTDIPKYRKLSPSTMQHLYGAESRKRKKFEKFSRKRAEVNYEKIVFELIVLKNLS